MHSQNRIKTAALDVTDALLLKRARAREINRYKDPRRVEIYRGLTLTDEQAASVEALYKEYYGESIPTVWHRYYSAITGKFDVNYFPELLYIPEFERFENLWPEYCAVYSDKNVLPVIAESAGIKMPETIVSCSKGLLRDRDNNQISFSEAAAILTASDEVFAKPSVDSDSGDGCRLISADSDTAVEKLFSELGNDFVIQKKIVCHESIRRIYPNSVNTFRIITYRWKNDVCFVPSLMRIGRNGNYLDNAHAGGIFIAVNSDGTLHDTAFTEFGERLSVHPDTGLTFDGYRIELFPKVLEAAKKMCIALPQLGSCNWDFTVDEDETPVLIEANTCGGSIWLSEIAHGCGPFGENTKQILSWMKLMKGIPLSQRYEYAFGKKICSAD